MKRVPLKRTKPLNRGSKGLKRGGNLKRSRLNPRSAKMAEKYVDRRALVERLLKERPLCEACMPYNTYDVVGGRNQRPSEHLHEIVLRSQGGNILDESIIVAVCSFCHSRVDDNRIVAELLGLYLRSYHYNDECVAEASRVRKSWASGLPDTPFYFVEEI